MMTLKEHGANMRRHRLRMGLTQKELGKRAGVTANTVSAAETGRYGSNLGALSRLAEALGLTVAEYISPPGAVLVVDRAEFVPVQATVRRDACDNRPRESFARELAEALGREIMARGLLRVKLGHSGTAETYTAQARVVKEAKKSKDGEV